MMDPVCQSQLSSTERDEMQKSNYVHNHLTTPLILLYVDPKLAKCYLKNLIISELAAVEERPVVLGALLHSRYCWCSQEYTVHSQFCYPSGIQYLVLQRRGPDRRSSTLRCNWRTLEYRTLSDHWETACPSLRSYPHVCWNHVEYAYCEQLYAIHGCKGIPRSWMGCFRASCIVHDG